MLYPEYRRLASAILLQAVSDLRYEGYQREVLEFFCSDWFTDLTEVADFDRRAISQQVKRDSFNKDVSFRAAYR